MSALSVRDLTVRYEGQERPVLEAVSFDLEEGRIGIVIGPNGSGKSTLVKAILGLVAAEGDVRVFGLPASEASPPPGYVAQRLPFDPPCP